MVKEVDVIVLGSGVAGGVAANALKKAGKSVVLMEPGPFGGTCPLRGCEPKKVFYDVVESMLRAQKSKPHGIEGQVSLDWKQLQKFKRVFTDPVSESVKKSLRASGIEVVEGKGKFTSENTVEANGQTYLADYIFIGTGARPRPLQFPGADLLLTNREFLELERLPGHMVFIGGGYISFEFAHMVARAGVRVEMLVHSDRCLRHFDQDLVGSLCSYSSEINISLHHNTEVASVEEQDGSFLVQTTGPEGQRVLKTGGVVHGAGRVANCMELDMEAGGVQGDERGIEVNEYMQSVSNEHVYAAGDVTVQGKQLTPVALMEAQVAVQNILEGNVKEVDYSGIPTVLFTSPCVAQVGMMESEAEKKSIPYSVHYEETSTWAPYRRLNEKPAAMKILFHKEKDLILGAHLMGHNSHEVINLYALAIRKKLTISDVKEMVWSYPSFGYTSMVKML